MSTFEEPKQKTVFESESEVLPCFEMNYKFLERHEIDKNPVNTAQKMASESSTTQDNVATTEEVPGSIVIYKKEKINTFHRDFKLSVLLFGHFISFRFATKEAKGVNYFPSRANDLEIRKKMLTINGL